MMAAASGDMVSMMRTMMLIRSFEAALVARRDHGFQLLSSGAEGVSVGLCGVLSADDQLLTSGRSIGPALARGLEPGRVMAELLGKSAGTNRGKGGRGHLAQPTAGFFGAHAVVGGNLTIAAGVALARQVARHSGVVVCLFGDGACGAGAVHEVLNIAAIWKLPLVLVCDNNQLSVSTPRETVLAPKNLSDLAGAFGIPGRTVDGMDVRSVRTAAEDYIEAARRGHGPAMLECVSERFFSHSTATSDTRSAAELDAIRARCPIDRLARDLPTLDRTALQAEVDRMVAEALAFADAAPWPTPDEVLTDVY